MLNCIKYSYLEFNQSIIGICHWFCYHFSKYILICGHHSNKKYLFHFLNHLYINHHTCYHHSNNKYLFHFFYHLSINHHTCYHHSNNKYLFHFYYHFTLRQHTFHYCTRLFWLFGYCYFVSWWSSYLRCLTWFFWCAISLAQPLCLGLLSGKREFGNGTEVGRYYQINYCCNKCF